MKKATRFYEENKQYILSRLKQSSELVSIELDSQALAKLFDMYAGIDYVLVNRKLCKLHGVAARVNFWHKTKGCLTIRMNRKSGAKTEYYKRLSSILNDDGSFYPSITIQLDSDNNGRPVGGILLKTKDLYLYLNDNIDEVAQKYMNVCSEGNHYLAIPYTVIRDKFQISCRIFKQNIEVAA